MRGSFPGRNPGKAPSPLAMILRPPMIPLLLAAMGLLASGLASAQVPSPEEHLGRPVGTDFVLADYSEVSSYYWRLAETSPHVLTQVVGQSTEGRDFLLSIISSPENLARLDEIKEHARIIADPRGASEERKRQAIRDGRVILLVSPQMHSTETAGSEAAMQFSWLLATSEDDPWATAREELVVGVFACTNPDGLDMVSHWYAEHKGTPFEGTGLLDLYQKYTGHDNNRDWFNLTQAETRIVTEQLYQVWRPQVYWDIHEQGSTRERFFVPPYRDPLNPNLDPGIVTGINAIGARALHDMTRAGLTGISTGVTYDMWWNGGNRSTPARHNIIGILTEAARVDLATPQFWRASDLSAPGDLPAYGPSTRFPVPWPGGWWRLADINRYKVAFGESLVGTLSREREFWLRNAMDAAERIIAKGQASGTRAWIIPSDNRDPDAVRRLAGNLLLMGIELHTAEADFDADGRRYPAGSIVIRTDQPYAAQVQDLFEVQRFPTRGEPPYDAAGWTAPLLMGVRRVEAMQPIDGASLARVETAEEAVAGFARPAARGEWPAHSAHSSSWTRLVEALADGQAMEMVVDGPQAGAFRPAGAADDGAAVLAIDRLPRIGVYSPWHGSREEGWMRWVLDEWSIPFQRVRNEQLRAGQLGDFLDVLLIVNMSSGALDDGRSAWSIPAEFAGGLAPEGAAAIEEFVRGGGKLVAIDAASDWAIEVLRLPVVDTTRGDGAGRFLCPGSVLRAIPATDQALAAGLPDSAAVFFARSRAFRPMTAQERGDARIDDKPIAAYLRYAPSRVLLSGWIREPEVIEGRDAWISVRHGHGTAHLFAFQPHYRGWSQGSFPMLFRAVLLDDPAGE